MGMDYNYAGSASYPRFDEELCAVAAVFGGQKTEHLKEREASIPKSTVPYWFGTLSGDKSDLPKFVFPENTDPVLMKWFNDIYGRKACFTAEETKTVWENVQKHPEIQTISHQIWTELEELTALNEPWDIS